MMMLSLACLFALLHGCSASYPNLPLERFDTSAGYRFDTLSTGSKNSDDVFICLTFSGGGTRAAAFAYGVLIGLRDTPITEGGSRRLLDEVDLISSVSGGSFTAMAYALWGDETFDGRFEEKFLRNDIERALLGKALNPANWSRSNSEIAADLYNEEVFDNATYATIVQRGQRPFVVLNASDVTRQEQFPFTQSTFDLLGSDLSKLPVSWAAAASSAYPILLGPLRFKYFPGDPLTQAIKIALESSSRFTFHKSRQKWARSLVLDRASAGSDEIEFDQDMHHYMYLLDGGLVDNLGLHYFFKSYRRGPIAARLKDGRIKHLVVIIVDSATSPPDDIESLAKAPGAMSEIVSAATSGMYTNTWLTTAVTKHEFLEVQPSIRSAQGRFREALRRACPTADVPEALANEAFESYVLDVNFWGLPTEAERREFLSIPTRFALESKTVDDLIRAGANLVKQHPEMKRLLDNLR